jgi:hypothetical protein
MKKKLIKLWMETHIDALEWNLNLARERMPPSAKKERIRVHIHEPTAEYPCDPGFMGVCKNVTHYQFKPDGEFHALVSLCEQIAKMREDYDKLFSET